VSPPFPITQLKYDAFDSRVRKQGPSGVTTSIAGLYESHEGAGGFRYTFVVHGPDGPIAEILYKPSEPNPRSIHYRHHDALGSVSVTTVQGGSAIRRYYEPFRAHVDVDGSPAAPPMHDVRHGFTGHAHDDDLGLIDMRGRVYSPSTRQFLTPDPLGRLGASPYADGEGDGPERIEGERGELAHAGSSSRRAGLRRFRSETPATREAPTGK
jgi:RHS repeat-associated protein